MSMKRFRDFIIQVVGEEYTWKEHVFSTDGIQIIRKLASRPPKLFWKYFDKAIFLPRIAIDGVMSEINDMTTLETTGEIGGFYLAFVEGLIEEIEDSRTDSAEYFKNELAYLNSITNIDNVEDLEATKEKVSKTYRNFMMNSSSYADAEYEGAALARALRIHLIVDSVATDGTVYQTNYRPDASEDVPTITLRFTQGNRNAHYVLDKVNEVSIPHSIYGDGDCLFSSIAQGILELYIQNSGDETASTLAQRRVSQIYKGFELGLIPRGKFSEMLHSNDDLFGEQICEKLCNLKEPLQDLELDILRDLMKYDAYQTVRIAASKVLYKKGTEEDKQIAKKIITELLTFPGFGMEHFDGYDLVREKAAEAVSFFIKDEEEEFIVDPILRSDLHNLMMHDAFQTVRIASAKVLYLCGNGDNKRLSEDVMTTLLNYADADGSTESMGVQIVRTKSIETIVILENITQETAELLEDLKNHESSISVRSAALQTLNKLGLFRNERWSVLIDKETQAKYATNGQVKLALQIHPFGCVEDMAMHKLLLDNKDSYGGSGNFILLLQKFLSTGPAEYPNKHSFAFQQALKYSIKRYYRLPGSDEETFVSKLFALPGDVTPTLEMFDLLLKDFISKKPQGEWTTHKYGLSHYQFMYTKHAEVASTIGHDTTNIYKKVINIVMGTVIKNLYMLLGIFSDHQKIQALVLSEEESKFIKDNGYNESDSSYQSLFTGENDDILHVNRYLKDSLRTSEMYTKMVWLQSIHNLLPYFKKNFPDQEVQGQRFLEYVEATSKAKEHPFQNPIDDFVTFLIELREMIFCCKGAQQMLGIGFEGSFFEAPMSSSFEDIPTIHLGFTEKFRIVGGVFLEHVICLCLKDHLCKVLGTKIQVRVESYVDPDLKVLYHYALSRIWDEVCNNRDNVDEQLSCKLESLVKINLNAKMGQIVSIEKMSLKYASSDDAEKESLIKIIKKSWESLDQVEAYIEQFGGNLEILSTINQKLNPSKGPSGIKPAVQPLTPDEVKIFNAFGKYILNEKILVCVETQLIPVLHSGLIFPVMLKAVNDKDPFLAFYLDEFRIGEFEHIFQFSVAKPCDKFCQPASTAYDLISEIHSEFVEIRGYRGSLVAERDFKKSVVAFSEEELSVIDRAIRNIEGFIYDERYKVYEEYRAASISELSVPVSGDILPDCDCHT